VVLACTHLGAPTAARQGWQRVRKMPASAPRERGRQPLRDKRQRTRMRLLPTILPVTYQTKVVNVGRLRVVTVSESVALDSQL
jgi:hypothetical protein